MFLSDKNLADRLASRNSELMSLMSSLVIWERPLTLLVWNAGVSNWTAYLSVVLFPISLRAVKADSSIWSPSVWARNLIICSISVTVYGIVRMIKRRSIKSNGIPCGETMSSVPLKCHRQCLSVILGLSNANVETYRMVQRPRFVANITIGAIADSNDLWRYVNVSRSNMWTSSINNTPGTNSAIPWSMYLLTTELISIRSLSDWGEIKNDKKNQWFS